MAEWTPCFRETTVKVRLAGYRYSSKHLRPMGSSRDGRRGLGLRRVDTQTSVLLAKTAEGVR